MGITDNLPSMHHHPLRPCRGVPQDVVAHTRMPFELNKAKRHFDWVQTGWGVCCTKNNESGTRTTSNIDFKYVSCIVYCVLCVMQRIVGTQQVLSMEHNKSKPPPVFQTTYKKLYNMLY